MRRLPALTKMYTQLKQLAVKDEEIIVPSDSLYIEAFFLASGLCWRISSSCTERLM